MAILHTEYYHGDTGRYHVQLESEGNHGGEYDLLL